MTGAAAAKLLADLPEVKSVEVARLHPGDVLVVECDQAVSRETAQRLEHLLAQVWPGHKAVVFDRGTHLRIARADHGGPSGTDAAECPNSPTLKHAMSEHEGARTALAGSACVWCGKHESTLGSPKQGD